MTVWLKALSSVLPSVTRAYLQSMSLMLALTIGQAKIRINGTVRIGAVSSGIVEVTKDQTSILAQSFEWADEIDVDRAEKAKALAQERMQQYKDDQRALDIAEYKLKRAINRINTANFKL